MNFQFVVETLKKGLYALICTNKQLNMTDLLSISDNEVSEIIGKKVKLLNAHLTHSIIDFILYEEV